MRSPILVSLILISCLAGADTQRADWHTAIQNNQVETLRALYRQQADVDQATEHGKTALMAAAAAGDSELLGRLLAAGADPAATNRLGGSVLMYAVGSGDLETVRRLLDTGIAADGRASNGWSAIMMAAAKNQDELLALLANTGADPNQADIYGWTPLMRAVFDRHAAAAAALLDLPAVELSRTNNNGQTALHLAVIGGNPVLVQTLLEHGARQLSDANGHTPQSIARELQRSEMLALLTDAGPDSAQTQ